MKQFKNTLIVVLVLVVSCLSSCRSKRQVTHNTESKSELQSVYKESYRDTTLYTPTAETTLIIPKSELSFKEDLNKVSKPKVYRSRSGNATAKVTVTPAGVNVVATCDSLALVAKIKAELIKESSNKEINSESTDKKRTGYTLFDLIGGFLAGVVTGIILYFLFKKFIRP